MPIEDPLAPLQHDVQRKLGRCMLVLQQYERLIKSMVAHMETGGAPEQLLTNLEKQVGCASKKTLGTLVGIFTDNILTSAVADALDNAAGIDADDNEASAPYFRVKFQMSMTPERHEQTRTALAELVSMRNDLVHHLLERFNLWQEDGLRAADRHLDDCFAKIDGHLRDLTAWAAAMENSRALMASCMETPQFIDQILHGIQPDGTVNWQGCTIVDCLREAETELAQGGWTLLAAAIAHVGRLHPEHTPKRYGCGSWRHVIHSSQQFQIRKTSNDNGGAAVWYRSLPEKNTMTHEQAA